jgi:hypothetical protein
VNRSKITLIALVAAVVAASGIALFPFILAMLFPHLKFQ